MANDNVVLSPGSGGAVVRTLSDGTNEWCITALCYATTVSPGANVLQVVTPSAGLPVAQQGTWTVGVSGTPAVAQSGTWTVTANAGTGTFAISAAALPLPTGAATSAKQPAIGTAGSAAADVLTIQGIASMTPVKVDGSAVTQPVSGTVGISGTVPVSGTFWQATQPVSGTVTANVGTTNGLALDATLTGGTQKTKLIDAGGTNVATVSAGGALKVDGSGATQPVSGTVTAAQATAASLNATVVGTGTFAVQASQAGTWTSRIVGNAGGVLDAAGQNAASPASSLLVAAQFNTTPTTLTSGNMSPLQMDSAGNLLVNVKAGGGAGGTSSSFGSSFPATGTAIGAKDSTGTNMAALNLDASGYLKVNVAAGGGSGGTSSGFGAALPGTGTASGFSDGTNMQAARVFDADSGAGTQYVVGVNLRGSASGGSVEIGTGTNPVRTDPTGTTTQPVSGTVTANAGTGTFQVAGTVTANLGTIAGIALDTSVNGLLVSQGSATAGEKGPLVQGAVTTSAPSYTTAQTAPLSLDTAGNLRVLVTPSGTQAVSGTVTANQGGTWTVQQGGTWNIGTVTSVASIGSNVTVVGTGTFATQATLQAGTALIGQASASGETSTIYSGTTALTPQFAAISASSSGANTIVAATGGKRIRVLRWSLSANGAVNAKWQTSTGPTDLSGLRYLTQFASAGGAYCPVGLFQTGVGDSLILNLSAAVAVGGELTYILV